MKIKASPWGGGTLAAVVLGLCPRCRLQDWANTRGAAAVRGLFVVCGRWRRGSSSSNGTACDRGAYRFFQRDNDRWTAVNGRAPPPRPHRRVLQKEPGGWEGDAEALLRDPTLFWTIHCTCPGAELTAGMGIREWGGG